MKIQIEVNGKQFDAWVNDNEMAAALAPMHQKTGYERAEYNGDQYFREASGTVLFTTYCYCTVADDYCYNSANYYTDEQVAENNVRADTLMRKLRRFAAEHGGCIPPGRQYLGWSIYLDLTGKLDICNEYSGDFGIIRFADVDAAFEAIHAFKDELIWYFTKYNPMPEGWKYE